MEEASKYRYPAGWQVVNTLVRDTTVVANLEMSTIPVSTSSSKAPAIHAAESRDHISEVRLEADSRETPPVTLSHV